MRASHLPLAILLLLTTSVVSPAQEGSPTGPLREALELLEAGDIDAAVVKLEALRASGRATEQALAVLGGLYVETGHPDEALEVLSPLADRDDADPAVLYNSGRAAARAGRIVEAERYLRRSLALEPRSPARRYLGFLLGEYGFDEEAYILLRSWALDNPDDFEARRAAAALAVRLVRVPDAEGLLSDLPQNDPGTQLLWGQVMLLKGDPWGALSYLNPLVEEAPAAIEMDVRRSVASAYLAVGEAASAIDVLEGHVDGDPEAALPLAFAYYQSGDLEQALATLEPIAVAQLATDDDLEEGPELEIVRLYGRLLVPAGRHEEAIPFLRRATEAAPEEKLAWQALGQALAAAGKMDEARQALARFQELGEQEKTESANQIERDLQDPTGAALRKALERYRNGDAEGALAMLRREAELTPEDPRPLLLASRLLLAKDAEAALGAAERAVELAPESADAHYQKGTVLLALRQVDEAETELRRALELAPEHTAAMSDLAVLLAGSDRMTEAKALLERVLELRPDDPVAAKNLERLRAKSDS